MAMQWCRNSHAWRVFWSALILLLETFFLRIYFFDPCEQCDRCVVGKTVVFSVMFLELFLMLHRFHAVYCPINCSDI